MTAAVSMRLEGVSDGVGLDGYQPRGMSIVELVTTSGRGDTTYPNVLLSSDGCYQLRVPAWETTDPASTPISSTSSSTSVDERRHDPADAPVVELYRGCASLKGP